jgi:glycosyltransferase involved in cell wall biosynthesis
MSKSKKNNPKFSIIVGVYNTKNFFKLTLLSVLTQSYRDFELIIVDDGSTDGTDKLIKEFALKDDRIRAFYLKKNSGKDSVPRNFGIHKAKGQYICFVDSDDLWHKEKLLKQDKSLKNDTIMVCTSCRYIDEKGKNSNSFFMHYFRKFLQLKFFSKGLTSFFMYNPVIFSSVMIKTSIMKRYMFNEQSEFVGIIDLELWLRLFKDKKKHIIFINEDLVQIRRRHNSLNRNYVRASVRSMHCVTKHFLDKKNFKYFNIFLIGIALKVFKIFLITSYNTLKRISLSLLFLTISFYFIIFYSPLFWYLGNSLLYFDQLKKTDNHKNIVVFSGHGDTSYYNMTYQYRYKDILNITSNKDKTENIFVLGRLQEIPEQRIIKKLLIADGYDENKIQIIYEEFNNTSKNIDNISRVLKDKDINEIIFITSPYHTKRAKLLWSKKTDINVKILKSYNWPSKNSFFEYSKNKKIIIYEYASIIYNKLIGNI